MEIHINEASSSLEVEGLHMTASEKENLRKALCGEFSFSDLVERPFREGNGRAQRVFANQLARSAGWELRLYEINPNELCEAYIESMHISTSHLEELLDAVARKR